MLIGIIGENCSGKSTLANSIKNHFNAEVVSGKDYLRMAKTEQEAVMLFKKRLKDAVTGENMIYITAEKEQAELLPEGAVRILVKADLDTIKERFRKRMHGNLPGPVEMMLERKHGMFDDGRYDFVYDGTTDDADMLCEKITEKGMGAA